jgi:hypothetical protein
MKNIVTLLMAALLAISATQAQTSTTDNPLFRHIPADADQVYAIHIAGLIGKVDMMSLMKLAQSQKFGKDNPMSYLSDISNTGIDLRQDIIIAQKTPLNTDSPTCVSILAHLTDSGKFVAFLRKNEKEIHFMHIQGKVRSATSGKQAYAWDDKLVTMVVIKHSKGQVVDDLVKAKYRATAVIRAVAAIRGFDHSFYASDERFAKGFSDDADIQIWNHGSSGFGLLSKLMQMAPAAASAHSGDFSQFVQKAHKASTLSTIRFESGKLVFQTTRYLTGDDSVNSARFLATPVGDKLLTAMPAGKVLGVVAMHVDLAASLDNLRKYGMDTKVDSSLSSKGLSTQDILHAFSGDFLFVANVPDTGKTPLLYGAVGIADKTAFDKVAGLLKPAVPAAGDTTPPKKQHLFLATKNDIAVISGSQQHADAWFNSTGSATPSRLISPDLRTNAFLMAIDFQVGADLLAKVLTKGDTIATRDQKLLDMIRQFDSFVATAPSSQHGATSMTYQLNFTDRNKNALASLMELAASAAKARKGN